MTDGILNEMEFEKKLEAMGNNPVELAKFLARQQYYTSVHCGKIENHLAVLNGSVKELQSCQQTIQMKQDNLLSRLWGSMPGWMQISLVVWLALSSLLVPTLGSIAIKLWTQ